MVVSRDVSSNSQLEGCVPNVGNFGTMYDTSGTNLAGPCPVMLENNIEYQNCLDNPSTCTYLYAAPSLAWTCKTRLQKRRSGAAKQTGEGALIGRRFVQHGS